ncbi:MAG: FIST C-terminal domain-containing protein [Rhodospirillales bacterium]|nr:FIST C-terminal domain-containing protein [Rhodospirillales bacterium]
MSGFKAVQVVGEDWAHVAQSIVDGLGPAGQSNNLGFIYLTDFLADDLTSILTYLRQRTTISHWVGSIATTICGVGGEVSDSPSAAVLVGQFPEQAFKVFPALETDTDQLPEATKEWMATEKPTFGILHADPNNANLLDILEKLAEQESSFFVGGMTSSETEFYQVADRLTGNGLSGVMFTPEVEVITGMSQGCAPISPTHVVSDSIDNIIVGLDGRRALDVLKDDIGPELASDLSKIEGIVMMAILVEGSDTGDYLVRELTAIDPVRGWLAVGEDLKPGDRILFVRRDPETALDDLEKTLRKMAARLDGEPKGGIYISCVGRGVSMFGAEGRELQVIKEVFGNIPLAGFHSAGEISNNRFYAYTGVLTLFT